MECLITIKKKCICINVSYCKIIITADFYQNVFNLLSVERYDFSLLFLQIPLNVINTPAELYSFPYSHNVHLTIQAYIKLQVLRTKDRYFKNTFPTSV